MDGRTEGMEGVGCGGGPVIRVQLLEVSWALAGAFFERLDSAERKGAALI